MKVLSIVGARPQFVKVVPVINALKNTGQEHFLLHTGQHYDYQLSQVFFDELAIPKPDINLEVGSGTHGKQTGEMLIGIEEVLVAEQPDFVLVYGDTNSTLAGAIATAKLQIPLGHIEAGLRSFNRLMPEEHNRVLTDHCSNLLFCPTKTSVENLSNEGITVGVHLVGDVMLDAVLTVIDQAEIQSDVLQKYQLEPEKYILTTIHRPYNVDQPQRLLAILNLMQLLDDQVIFPIHPRTQKKIAAFGYQQLLDNVSQVRALPPVSYLDMLVLEKNAKMIVTDSGGIQKEAYFFSVPCLTIRPETEWIETVEAGWNQLIEPTSESLAKALNNINTSRPHPPIFGNGDASEKIVQQIKKFV